MVVRDAERQITSLKSWLPHGWGSFRGGDYGAMRSRSFADALKGTGEEGSVGTGSRVGRRPSIRVAYVGPTPLKGAGGPQGCAWLVLEELARSGARLDLYLTITEDRKEIAALGMLPGAKVIPVGSVWRWNRWYSRNHLMAMVTGLGTDRAWSPTAGEPARGAAQTCSIRRDVPILHDRSFRSTAGPAEASHNGAPSERPCGGGAAMDAERARTVTAL